MYIFSSLLPLWLISIEQQRAEVLEMLKSSDFCIKLWIDSNVEVIVNFLDLSQVLVLHLSSGSALLAWVCRIWEENLVNDDVSNVDFLLCKLDGQSFCFIHAQELWDAYSNESSFSFIFKLLIDLFNLLLHSVHALKELFMHNFWSHLFTVRSRLHHATH